jgi:hypothetical protein
VVVSPKLTTAIVAAGIHNIKNKAKEEDEADSGLVCKIGTLCLLF